MRKAFPLCRAGQRLAVLMLAACLGWLPWGWTMAQPAAPSELRFAMPELAGAPPLGAQLLSAEERSFIASLPELRVAVPQPLARPYQTLSADGRVGGIHGQMLAYLASAFGLKLKPVLLPSWSAALEAARRGEVDLLMSVGVTPERAQFLAFTLGATPAPAALFARRSAAAARSASGPAGMPPLETATYALERDYLANDFVRRQYPQARILSVGTTGEALAAVAQGKADYYLGSLLEAIDWLDRQPQPDVQVQQLLNHGTGHYHFAVRQPLAPLVTILNKGIATLRQAPSAELKTALAALPDRLALPLAMALGPADTQRLIQRPVWRLGAVRGLAMLNDVSPDGQHSGIGAEYAEQVAQQLGVALQVVPFDNVAAMLEALREGRIDLVPFLTRTAERERLFGFSEPYVSMPYKIVARSDAPLYWGLSSLRGKRLALAAAHPLRELLAQRYPDIEIVTTANGQEAMDAVAEGRADAAVEVKLFANLRIHGDNDGMLRAVADVEELPAQFHFAAGPRGLELIPIVNRALAQISPAERERIWRRWVALDLAPEFPWNRYLPYVGLLGAALGVMALGTVFWMRRLQREATQRRRSEERLADIGAALPCVAFRYVLGLDHGVVGSGYFSAGAAELLGERPDPSLSLLDNLGARLREEHLQEARRLEANSWATGTRLRFMAAYAHPDGQERWLRVEAVSKPIEPGLVAWTGTAVDVTAERELQDRVDAEAKARHLMLASASHELRAPTHTLSLALDSLAGARPEDGATRDAAMRVAQDAVRTLGQLLNDVLDAAQLDRGELQLRPQTIPLRELIAQVASEAQVWADRKALSFSSAVDAAVPVSAWLDPLRVRQVLTNLLSNAVKYTPQGQVGLRLSLSPLPEGDAGQLCFEVTDSGPGIDPQRQARLFAPFSAVDPLARPVPEGSSGLGLSISLRLAQLMGGELKLLSEPGRGTRASLILPVPVPVPVPRSSDAAPAPATSGAEAAVLLCEDDPTCRLLMAQMLRVRGYAVAECESASQALTRWQAGGIRAIVTDLQMDGMDGLRLVQSVRAGSGAGEVRLIVCSGNAAPAREASDPPPPYDAWLTKPVQMSVLLATLGQLGVAPRSEAAV